MSRFLILVLALAGCSTELELEPAAQAPLPESVNVRLDFAGRDPQDILAQHVHIQVDSLGEVLVLIAFQDSIRVIMSPTDCWPVTFDVEEAPDE